MSEDQLSEAAGRLADLSVVTLRKQHQGQSGKKDEEQSQEQLSVVVNSNGVCHCAVVYARQLISVRKT